MKAKRGQLYFHREYDCYTCLGCGATIEVPWQAILKAGQGPVSVKESPENRVLWLELIEIDHGRCLNLPRGFDGSGITPNAAPVAS
jgi:hypothetical protein